jgi:hypothetical protein
MNLSELVRAALQRAGYRCAGTQDGDVVFEDDTLLGFVSVQGSARDILGNWRAKQEDFLRSHATPLRKDAGKAWNVYSVFLAPNACAPEEAAALLEVEEDFVGTRKLARAGIETEDDVSEALYPLLPIENSVALAEGDALVRVRARLDFLAEITALITGTEEVSLEEIADELVRRA